MTMKTGITIRIRIEVTITEIREKMKLLCTKPYIHCSYLRGKTDLVTDILCPVSKSLLDKL